MYYAIDVENAGATAASDKAMIFVKILSYEEGQTGFTLCEWPPFESGRSDSFPSQQREDTEACWKIVRQRFRLQD